MNYQKKYEEYRIFAEEVLRSALEDMHCHTEILQESIGYSLTAGGTRIRPVLFFAMLEAFGMDYRKERAIPVAIECIHTYSLIHDDLPAMDDDDFRRGKPSNHKVFGEAHAILAGDGLLSYAFELLIKESFRGKQYLTAAQTLAVAAGVHGMVAGQSADLLYSGRPLGEVGEAELLLIRSHKTAELLAAPLVMAANLAGRWETEARDFGMALGHLFQTTDDILDEIGDAAKVGKTLGKDRAEGKLTCVGLYGLDGAKRLADRYAASCNEVLDRLSGQNIETEFLRLLVEGVRNRKQ